MSAELDEVVRRLGRAGSPEPPAPVPEGMETTAEERAEWRDIAAGAYGGVNRPPRPSSPTVVTRLLDDLDRALAEIARLRAAVLAEREACAVVAEHEAEVNHAEGRYIAGIIRARPTP